MSRATRSGRICASRVLTVRTRRWLGEQPGGSPFAAGPVSGRVDQRGCSQRMRARRVHGVNLFSYQGKCLGGIEPDVLARGVQAGSGGPGRVADELLLPWYVDQRDVTALRAGNGQRCLDAVQLTAREK